MAILSITQPRSTRKRDRRSAEMRTAALLKRLAHRCESRGLGLVSDDDLNWLDVPEMLRCAALTIIELAEAGEDGAKFSQIKPSCRPLAEDTCLGWYRRQPAAVQRRFRDAINLHPAGHPMGQSRPLRLADYLAQEPGDGNDGPEGGAA